MQLPFPPGLPTRIEGANAWYGPAMAARSDWIETFATAELDELAAASEPWLDERIDLAALTRQKFALPALMPRIVRMQRELLDGRGFALWRGLPIERWGRRRSAVAFYGLGTHFGNPLSQNAQGHVLGHVRDMGLSSNDPNVRIYQTHERQTFHTDSADLVGWRVGAGVVGDALQRDACTPARTRRVLVPVPRNRSPRRGPHRGETVLRD